MGERIDEMNREVVALIGEGRYREALPLASDAVTVAREHLGEHHPDYATSLDNLGAVYYSLDRLSEAEPLYRQALEVRRNALGGGHPDYATSLNNLGMLHHARGEYDRAEALLREAVAVARGALGQEAPEYAAGLGDPATVGRVLINHAESDQLFTLAADYATSLDNLARVYHGRGNHAAAEDSCRLSLMIRYELRGELPLEYSASLALMADLALDEFNYAKAELLLRRAVRIRRRVLGDDHQDSIDGIFLLATINVQWGNLNRAERLGRRVLEILRNTRGEEHLDCVPVLVSLATVYREKGAPRGAVRLCRRALRILRACGQEGGLESAHSLSQLADLYGGLGQFARARRCYCRALRIYRRVWGADSRDYGIPLAALTDLYRLGVNLRKAESLSSQRVGGQVSRDYALTLAGLAELYRLMGNLRRAESLYGRSLGILLKTGLEEDEIYPRIVHRIGVMYYAIGKLDDAEVWLLKLLKVSHGRQGHEYALAQVQLAGVYVDRGEAGDYAMASRLYRRGGAAIRGGLGDRHPYFAGVLYGLAKLYSREGVDRGKAGDYAMASRLNARAEKLLRQALEIYRSAFGDGHPDCATVLECLALTRAALGRADEALSLLQQAANIDDQLLGQVFTAAPEYQRLVFLARTAYKREFFLSLAAGPLTGNVRAAGAALDLVLRRKMLVAEAACAQRDAFLSETYHALRPQLKEWAALRARIARSSIAGPDGGGVKEHRAALARLRARKNHLEVELASRIPEVRLERELKAADRRAVARDLPPGSALVEFALYVKVDFQAVHARDKSRWRYLAFVLPAGRPDELQMIDLGEAEPIDQLINRFREEIAGQENDGHAGRTLQTKGHHTPRAPASDPGQLLRQRVFDPVANAVADCRQLILSPDGALACLPFEVLPGGSDGRLIDTYQISYVASGRDVLRFNVGTFHQPDPALVVAAPNFDFDGTQVPLPSATLLTPAKANRCSRDIDHLSRVHLLPGMELEGKCIAARLGIQPWLGDAALEGRLKKIRSPRILHLVSHAFFLPNQPARPPDGLRGFGGLHGPVGENPMLRSGLLLAGYNTWLDKRPLPVEAEDGILTAEDVTGLDLLDTELVVLSACDTGLGVVQAGEGVFGLRRAFTVAGARTLVMSLWKVPDEVTQKLMGDFYDRILAGEHKAEALRQAQLALRKDYPTPRHWGAFICQGDPGPLRHPGN